MPASATMIGALLGLGTQMYSNALRKLPCMRHPWEHGLGMGLGVVSLNQLVKWDAKLQEDLDKMLGKAMAANVRRYFGLSEFSCSCVIIAIHFLYLIFLPCAAILLTVFCLRPDFK
ncbi:hypothetical protein F0562_029614 [Nyssa sinensis]|uniref:Uncharacterized protein n=1 Tax=Nyssa sinensis TaxID=561372 RepID=A0A5J5B3K3_9ASTE|nr:hypothetical protein F0562_029614 [Nyssa sinensis]